MHAYSRGGCPSHGVLPAAASPEAINQLLDVIDAQLPWEIRKSRTFLYTEDRLRNVERAMAKQRLAAVAAATQETTAPPGAKFQVLCADSKQLLALLQSPGLPRGASLLDKMYGELSESQLIVHAETMELLCGYPARWGELSHDQLLQLQRYACEQAYAASLRLLEHLARTVPLSLTHSFVAWRAWSVLLESSLRLGKHADLQSAGAALRLYAEQWCAHHCAADRPTTRIVRETVEAAIHEKLGRASALEGKWSQAHSYFHRAIEAQHRQIHTPIPDPFDETVTDAVECMLYGGVRASDPLEFEMRLLQSASHASLKRGAAYLPLSLAYAREALLLTYMDPAEPKLDRLDAAVKVMDEARTIAETMANSQPPMAEGATTLPPSLRAHVESSFAAAIPLVSELVEESRVVLQFHVLHQLVSASSDPSLQRRAERLWAEQRRAQTMAAAYQQAGRVLETVPQEANMRIRERLATLSASDTGAVHSAGELATLAIDAARQLARTSFPTAQSLENFKQQVWEARQATRQEAQQKHTEQQTAGTEDKPNRQ